MLKVFVDLSGTRRLGQAVRINTHTLWVKIMRGARTYDYIKRHIRKHNVTIYVTEGESIDETIHTSIRHKAKAD